MVYSVQISGRRGRSVAVAATLISLLLLIGCNSQSRRLRLATTTTTVDSGLMAAILPAFEQEFNVQVDVIAVGTGEALALGKAGDVDVILVHARPLEDEFMAEGFGIRREDVMYNDFVLLGPANDPAGVAGSADIVDAFGRISATDSLFVSRGDRSGTHLREQALWAAAGIVPDGEDWYQSLGQGMGATLTAADELRAYVLCDRGTFIARQAEGLSLEIVMEKSGDLLNPYGVIAVNPALHERINAELATQFIDWIKSPETRQAINQYKVSGQQLFFASED